MSAFKKAIRTQTKLKLAVTGPTGSGKTYSSLLLAKGLGNKVAVIDTENGSASLYADKFEFDVLEIKPPFETEKYIAAINDAVSAGYDVVVVDSITHAWALEGGLLAQKEQIDARGGNSYTNWAKITKKQDAFMSVILQSNIHVITTMRSKMAYELVQDSNGKSKPQKMGLAPQQRDGVEYEYSIVFDVGMNHEAEVSKDRTGLFTDKIFKINEETGKTLIKWLNGASTNGDTKTSTKLREPTSPAVSAGAADGAKTSAVKPGSTNLDSNDESNTLERKPQPEPVKRVEGKSSWYPSDAQIKRLYALCKKAAWSEPNLKSYLKEQMNLTSTKELSHEQYELLTGYLDKGYSFESCKNRPTIYRGEM